MFNLRNLNWTLVGTYVGATVAAWYVMRAVVPEHYYVLVGTILGAISTFVSVILNAQKKGE